MHLKLIALFQDANKIITHRNKLFWRVLIFLMPHLKTSPTSSFLGCFIRTARWKGARTPARGRLLLRLPGPTSQTMTRALRTLAPRLTLYFPGASFRQYCSHTWRGCHHHWRKNNRKTLKGAFVHKNAHFFYIPGTEKYSKGLTHNRKRSGLGTLLQGTVTELHSALSVQICQVQLAQLCTQISLVT